MVKIVYVAKNFRPETLELIQLSNRDVDALERTLEREREMLKVLDAAIDFIQSR